MTNKVESNVSDQTEKRLSPEVSEQFQQDTRVVAKQAAEFIEEIHPARLLQTNKRLWICPMQNLMNYWTHLLSSGS